MTQQTEQTSDPRYHSRHIRGMIDDLVNHVREDVGRVEDPRAEALFETTVEVLSGLRKAYEHYEKKSEEAWRQE
jgi:predicted metal-dependent hydrolase